MVRHWNTDTCCLDAGLRLDVPIATREKALFPEVRYPPEAPGGYGMAPCLPLEMLGLRQRLYPHSHYA